MNILMNDCWNVRINSDLTYHNHNSIVHDIHFTIITTNKNLSKCSDIFCNPIIANTILNRLLHYSHVINIVGPSSRTKEILEALKE